MLGELIVAATPLGNPGDASLRLREVLAAADVVAAEDTRRFARLAADLGIAPLRATVVSYFDSVEESRTPGLLHRLVSGDTVVLVSDAGMPLVNDPGYRLVQAAIEADVPVTVVPGPSAVLAALATSGLPADRFCFEGFPPRKSGQRARWFAELATEPRTIVFFESPHRIAATMAAAAAALGEDRRGAICRELTKNYEEVRRGRLGDLAAWAAEGVRGEITVVIEGAGARAEQIADPAQAVAEAQAAGLSRKEAIAEVAARIGRPKREVYDAVVTQRSEP